MKTMLWEALPPLTYFKMLETLHQEGSLQSLLQLELQQSFIEERTNVKTVSQSSMYHASETQAATAEDKHSFSTTYSSPSATVTNWDFNKDGRFGNNNCSGVNRVINNSRVLQSRSTAVITTAPDVKDAIQQQAKAPCYSFALFSRDPQSWN